MYARMNLIKVQNALAQTCRYENQPYVQETYITVIKTKLPRIK